MEHLSSREPSIDDLPAILALIETCDAPYNLRADVRSEEHIRRAWESPTFDKAIQTRVYEKDGRIVGYVETWFNEPWSEGGVWARLHPDAWSEEREIAMMCWAEEVYLRVAEEKTEPHLQLRTRVFISAKDERKLATLEAAGYTYFRSFYRMLIELEGADIPTPTLPEGYSFRGLRIGDEADEHALFMTIHTAFADHYGHVERDPEEVYKNWRHWVLDSDRFDPSLVWIIDAPDGTMAAATINNDYHGSDDEIGWVNTLGTLREHRRKGLALALLHKSFAQFKERGYERVGLGVDADSITGALRLYEQAGMSIAIEHRNYEKIHRVGEVIHRT